MGQMPSLHAYIYILGCFVCLSLFVPQEAFAQQYVGYRIGLFNFELVGKKNKTLRCSAVNTGREAVFFEKNRAAPPSLIVEVDTISLPESLRGKKQFIRLALLHERVNLKPGEIMSSIDLEIEAIRTIEQEMKEAKAQAEQEVEKAAATPTPQIVETKITEEPIKEPIPTPNTPPVVEAKPTKEPIKPVVSSPPSAALEKETPIASNEEASKGEIEAIPKNTYFDYDKKCPDLVFDSVWVISVNNRDIVLGFIIHNIGQKPARITGKKRSKNDNVAVNIYFISGNRLTRGALLADGIFLGDSRNNPSGVLAANGRMSGEVSVSTTNRTRFSPNVVFELDPFYSLLECDETNNTMSLEIPFVE